MSKRYWVLAFLFVLLGWLFLPNEVSALTTLNSQVKFVKLFKYGDKCGVGTDCLVDNSNKGVMQGFTLTPTHIVMAFLIDEEGYSQTTRSRIYFIDRSTFKVVKTIPEKKNFTCNKYGDAGCYGHVSSLAYNYSTGKILLATQESVFVFDDATMNYEKKINGLGSSKLAYNETYDWYWTGREGNKVKDVNFKDVKKTNTEKYPGTKSEEGPATWNSYLVVNNYKKGSDAILRFYNHKEDKHFNDFQIAKTTIKTEIIKGLAFGSDGSLFLMVPSNNKGTGWGHGAAIYAISGKSLGISDSKNQDINSPTITTDPKTSNCDSSDANCDCGAASTRKHLDPGDRPDVVVAPTREVQCTSILPGSLCSSTNSTASIGDILSKVIDFLTVSAGMAGTIGVLITGYIVMTASGDPGKLTAASNRFYAIVIGLVLWCSMSIIIDLFALRTVDFGPVVDNSGSSESGGGQSSGGGSSGAAKKSTVQPTCIKLSTETIRVAVGESKSIGYTIYPANATNKSVTWLSADDKIAKVSSGKVTGVKAGETTITAKTSNGKTSKVKVIVTNKSSAGVGKSYGVYLGLDYRNGGDSLLNRLSKHDHVVIDFQEGFPKSFIDKLHAKGIKVYSYLNVGALEVDGTRDYASRFGKSFRLGAYDGWPGEQWIDASKKEWQDFITNELEPKLRAKGADGYYIDNLDVYGLYKHKRSGMYAGLQNILRKIHSQGVEVMINGADEFVTRAIQDGSYKEMFDGVNQEEVFSDNGGHQQNSEDTKYFSKYLEKTVKPANLFVYLLEYGKDKGRLRQIQSFCNKNGFGYYYSSKDPYKNLE